MSSSSSSASADSWLQSWLQLCSDDTDSAFRRTSRPVSFVIIQRPELKLTETFATAGAQCAQGLLRQSFCAGLAMFLRYRVFAAMQLNIEIDQLFKMSSVDGRKSLGIFSESNKYHQLSALRLIFQRKAVAMREVQRIQNLQLLLAPRTSA